MEYTKLMSVLDDCFDADLSMIIYLDNGCIFKSGENTGAFESNNDFDMDDSNFKQYYACIVLIAEIVKPPKIAGTNPLYDELQVGDDVEFSICYEPLKIETVDGVLLWSRKGNTTRGNKNE